MTPTDRRLTVNELDDSFLVADASWVVYRRRDGSVGIQPATRRGLANVAACRRAGGRVILRVQGVSRREALALALARATGKPRD
jgi:hypothetical protein